jgi:hypothetical protein
MRLVFSKRFGGSAWATDYVIGVWALITIVGAKIREPVSIKQTHGNFALHTTCNFSRVSSYLYYSVTKLTNDLRKEACPCILIVQPVCNHMSSHGTTSTINYVVSL